MLDFRPPEDNALVIGLCKLFMPQILLLRCSDLQVRINGDGRERFKKLAGKHVLICPNHSYRHDPEVMFDFGRQCGEAFNFVAAREVFDYNNGFNGWLLQKLGCYSVVRGAADRESFKTTKSILSTGKKKLVLFPEGEISWQNESILPLESGAVQLSFWALDEMQKTMPQEPVYVLPIALKYTYRTNITKALDHSITLLEKHLGIHAKHEDSMYQRTRNAALKVLEALERQYGCKVAENAALNDRMTEVKERSLRSMAKVLDLELPPIKNTYLDWVRILRNAMDDFIFNDTTQLSDYERKVHEERTAQIKKFYRDLDRIVGFIAIYDGYLNPPATQERIANVVEMLEGEVFGEKTIKGPRLVTAEVGEPINLLDVYAEYKKSKRAVLEKATSELSKQIHGMLDGLEKQREAVYVN
ncbi:MAG TPA: lysophospholipid acyltransferase family protein [Candidatus Obscuribacterales bacterium]